MDTSSTKVMLQSDRQALKHQGFNVIRSNPDVTETHEYKEYANNAAIKRTSGVNAHIMSLMYHKNTDLLAQFNESWNANRSLNIGLNNEKKRLEKHTKTAMVDIYKMRQEALQFEFDKYFYECMVRVISFSIFMLSIILTVSALQLLAKFGLWVSIPLIVTALLVYIVGMVIMIRRLADRRIMDWQRFYWKKKPSDSVQIETCPQKE